MSESRVIFREQTLETFYSSARATLALRANLHSKSCCCIDYAHTFARARRSLIHLSHGDRRHDRRNGVELDSATVSWTSSRRVQAFEARPIITRVPRIVRISRSLIVDAPASFLRLRFISRSTSSFPLVQHASIHGGRDAIISILLENLGTPVSLSLKSELTFLFTLRATRFIAMTTRR